MAKSKGARILVTLECSRCNSSGLDHRGIFRYTTSKNRRNNPQRMELHKFCPYCNGHFPFKEIK